MQEAPQLNHVRVDDIPLLIGILMQMNVPQIYDREIGDHGLHSGLSGGWLFSVWAVFVLSQGDHAKSHVMEWVRSHAAVLQQITGQAITAEEFNDTRLGRVLSRVSRGTGWDRFEAALWAHGVTVYELEEPSVGGLISAMADSTTAYGYHESSAEGVMQRGYSKDHRADLPQLKLMTMSVHPHGLWIATQVEDGNTADDGLYVPLIERTRGILGHTGVLYVGDSKMAALATRGHIAARGDYYLTVAPHTGETAAQLAQWIEDGLDEKAPSETLHDAAGEDIGKGYEFSRECRAEVPLGVRGGLRQVIWNERVQVIRSDALMAQQAQTLERHLSNAEDRLRALNQTRGRGHRRLSTQAEFDTAVQTILDEAGVSDLLHVMPHIETHTQMCQIGPGRRSPNRPLHEVTESRYTVDHIERDSAAIQKRVARLGWRVQLTNAPAHLSLNTCVLHYRANWLGERNYHWLKDQPIGITPLWVHNDDQIIGLTYLLTLCTRVLSLLELQARRGLKREGATLIGLNVAAPNQTTDHPTALAILKAIARMEITLTCIVWQGKEALHLTALPPTLVQILRYLHLSTTLYENLAISTSPNSSVIT